MTYLFWSLTKTLFSLDSYDFLILNTLYVRSISYDSLS